MAYDGIEHIIKERLGVTSLIMKYFDTDVNKYIDLELNSCDFVRLQGTKGEGISKFV